MEGGTQHVPATNAVDTPRRKEPRVSTRVPPSPRPHDGRPKLDYQLQAAPNRKLFRRQEQSPHAILRRAVVA